MENTIIIKGNNLKNLYVNAGNSKVKLKTINEILNEQLKDNIKFHILWYLDDTKCSIALTKAKDLSQAVEKIIEEIKNSIDK